VLLPSPGDLPNPGIESVSPALAGGFLTTLTTTIQHSFGSFGHNNQSRKRNKRNPNRLDFYILHLMSHLLQAVSGRGYILEQVSSEHIGHRPLTYA